MPGWVGARTGLAALVGLTLAAAGFGQVSPADLPRERTMFGPLVCGAAVLAGIQDRAGRGAQCRARLFCLNLTDGRPRWRRDYAAADMMVELRPGPAGTALLPLYRGGAFVIRLSDGQVIRRLTATPDAAWQVTAASPTTLFCAGRVRANGGPLRPAVSAFDARTLRRLWRHTFPQTSWGVSALQVEDGRVQATVTEPYAAPAAARTGPACPVGGKLVGCFLFAANTGRLLGREAYPVLRERHPYAMTAASGQQLTFGGGNASRTAFYEEARDTQSKYVVWRLAFEGLHDSVLVPPAMLVAYGQFDYTDERPPRKVTPTRTLVSLEAATGHVNWQVGLEPGPLVPPRPQPVAAAVATVQQVVDHDVGQKLHPHYPWGATVSVVIAGLAVLVPLALVGWGLWYLIRRRVNGTTV